MLNNELFTEDETSSYGDLIITTYDPLFNGCDDGDGTLDDVLIA